MNALDTFKRIHFQVANVHKCPLSAIKFAGMGYICILKKDGGFLEDEETGELILIERRGNLNVLGMMVKGAKLAEHPGPGFDRKGRIARSAQTYPIRPTPPRRGWVGDGAHKLSWASTAIEEASLCGVNKVDQIYQFQEDQETQEARAPRAIKKP